VYGRRIDDSSPAHQYLNKNTHSHTHFYYRTDKDKQIKKCRFNIPYSSINETCILTMLTESARLEITGARYKIQVAILHIGQPRHYITYLRQETSNWICVNDTTVTEKR
jgi:hypothetical protein